MTHRSHGFRVALACLLTLALGAVATAAPVVIQPSVQDTTIKKNLRRATNGRGGRIRVHSSPLNNIWRGLVQFDLSAIPQFSLITSSTLELYESRRDVLRTYGAHRVLASWLEATANWENQPSAVLAPTATLTVGDIRAFKSFPVGGDVQGWVNDPLTNHGWMIKDQSESGVDSNINFVAKDTRKSTEFAKRPRLTIDFTAPTCTSNADCQDSNPCTTSERCESGHCAVTPVSCDDADPCTDDLCDPGSGCINTFGCDDGFDCTVDSCTPAGCENLKVNANCTNGGCTVGTCDAEDGNEEDPNFDPNTGCTYTSVAPDGTPCTDGDLCTQTDTCSFTDRTCVGADPVTCSPLDQCHVAGTCAPGTGLCSNPPADDGTPCSDGDVCTQDDACDGSGNCVSGSPVGSLVFCGDSVVQPTCGEECDGGPDCSATCLRICGAMRGDCKLPTVAQKARLQIKDRAPDSKDRFAWKWLKGAATTLAELGDPTTATDFHLCVYDASVGTQPLMTMALPAGGTCGTRPCWKGLNGKGFKRKNAAPYLPDGDQSSVFKVATAGKGNMQVKGRDVNLPLPGLPLTAPVTVQLRNGLGTAGTCWSATFSAPVKNTAEEFKAKGD
ncbi:MAG: DNRLRE domain-containing protein [Candidatus Binatia bacterium]